MPIVDEAMIFDNSEGKHDLIAKKTIETKMVIYDEIKYFNLKNYINEKE